MRVRRLTAASLCEWEVHPQPLLSEAIIFGEGPLAQGVFDAEPSAVPGPVQSASDATAQYRRLVQGSGDIVKRIRSVSDRSPSAPHDLRPRPLCFQRLRCLASGAADPGANHSLTILDRPLAGGGAHTRIVLSSDADAIMYVSLRFHATCHAATHGHASQHRVQRQQPNDASLCPAK